MDRDDMGNIEAIKVTEVKGDLTALELMTIALGAIVNSAPHNGLIIKAAALNRFFNGESTNLEVRLDPETGDMLLLLVDGEDKNAVN